MSKFKYVIGIDEAGRGPLAGPVAVGVAVVPRSFDWVLIPNVGDSKKVSEKNREAIFRLTKILKRQGILDYRVALISSKDIDTIGISKAVQKGIRKCLTSLSLNPKTVDVKLDGLLKAPEEYITQETIIKGDSKEKVIGLASIMAKVTRDAHMCKEARKYPRYGFEIHKGYGTERHRNVLKKYGPCPIHRRAYTKNALCGSKYEEIQ